MRGRRISETYPSKDTLRLREHLLPGSVALIFLILALDYGGFPTDATAAVAIGAWWILVFGLVLGLLPRERIDKAGVAAILLLLGLAVLTTSSIGWAPDQGRAFSKTVQFAGLFGLFTLVLFSSRRGSAREWAAGIVTGLFLVVLLAALGRFFPGLGDDTQLTRDLAGTEGRLSWPLGYWNAMGGLSGMTAVGLLWFSANGLSSKVRAISLAGIPVVILVLFLTSSRGGFLALAAGAILAIGLGPGRRLMAGGLAVAVGGGLALSFLATRMPALLKAEDVPQAGTDGLLLLGATVVVALAIGLGCFLLDSKIQNIGPFKPKVWKYALGLLGIIAVLVALNPGQRVEDFAALPGEQQTTGANTTTDHLLSTQGSGRAQVWEPAIGAFKDEPVLGVGTGGFETYYLTNREVGWIAKHSHSLILQVGAELGAVGLLLLLGFLATAIFVGFSKWREGRAAASVRLASVAEEEGHGPWQSISLFAGIAVAGAVSMSVDWSAEFPVVSGGVLACLALVIGPATEPARQVPVEGSPTAWERLLVAVLIPVGLLSLWGGITSLRVETELDASRVAVSDGDLELARSKASEAIDILPMAGAPRIQLALVEELDGNHRAALVAVDRGIERDPEKSANYLLKARILLRLGREQAAGRAFRQARTLNPNDPIFQEAPPS